MSSLWRSKKLEPKTEVRLEPYLRKVINQHKIKNFPRVRSWKYNREFVNTNAIKMVNMSEFIGMVRELFAGTLYIDSYGYKHTKAISPIDISFPLQMLFINPMGIMYYISGYGYIYCKSESEINVLIFSNRHDDGKDRYVLLNDGTVV